MKIIDGLKLEGKKVEIPDAVRADLPQFFVDMGYKKGVEVGVWRGAFTELLLNAGLTVYGIDPYLDYDDCPHYGRQKRVESVYNETKDKMSKYENGHLIRKMSMDAVDDFEDESLDFVYIDGNHKFRYIAEDLFEWTKKIKKGGCISGHDYIILGGPGYIDVKYVVNAFVASRKVKTLYILGKQRKGKRDRFRSWFWIKDE